MNLDMPKLYLFQNIKYLLDEKEQIIINNIEDLKNILKNLKFNCVYLIGFTNQESFEFLQNSQKLQALF